ncbi:MAG: hypothetical protein QXI16_00565 [Sulfolobaceae archaeon]
MKNELINKLKINFKLTDEDLLERIYITLTTFKDLRLEVVDLSTVQKFIYHIEFWFSRQTLARILNISLTQYYKLYKYLNNDLSSGVSQTLVNKLDLFRIIVIWYLDDHEEKL